MLWPPQKPSLLAAGGGGKHQVNIQMVRVRRTHSTLHRMRVSHISRRGAADCPLGALCPSVPSAVSYMLIPALGLACWREGRHQVSMQMARGRKCESAKRAKVQPMLRPLHKPSPISHPL
jgi:hypothetical protein